MRLGLVGCGRLAARGYLPAFRRAYGVGLAAIADVEPARCAALARDIPAFGSARALVAAGGVDGVVIATPTRAHAADARIVAEAGLPVLVEKPPGLDAADTAGLAALHPLPRVGFNRRFEPDLVALRDVASASGRELFLMMHYRRGAWGPHDMRDDALLDLAPHLVDLARWLSADDAVRVRARTVTRHRAAFEIELRCHRATVRCASDRVFAERVEVRDASGHTVAEYRRGGLVHAVLDRLRPRTAATPLVTTLTRQLEAFGRVIRGGHGAPLATANDGLAVMCVLDAVRRSVVANGAWVPAAEPARTR